MAHTYAADVAPTLVRDGAGVERTGNERTEADFLVTHTLRAEGFDASEDGAGRGIPLVSSFALRGRDGGAQAEIFGDGSTTGSLRAASGGSSRDYVAFTCKDDGADANASTAPTLRALAQRDSSANGGGQVAIAFGFADVADPVAANQGRTYTREGSHNFRLSNVAVARNAVRRLTPMECERLQGFPDRYTLVPYRHGKLAADGPRYRAIGNSMAVPVMAWIGARIDRVEAVPLLAASHVAFGP
ncbi:MAG: hypothetical protein NVSMB19_23090 [Vulcanimicrobiaceae bacterium]